MQRQVCAKEKEIAKSLETKKLGFICIYHRGYSHPIYKVYAAVKGRVFEQFSLGQGIEIRELWSRKGYRSPYKQLLRQKKDFRD